MSNSYEAVKPSLTNQELTNELKRGARKFDEIAPFIKGGQEIKNNQVVKPMTWNENAGVLIFSDENGETYVNHSEKLRADLLKSRDYIKDEQLGVPNLNEAGTWPNAQSWENWNTSN